MATDKDIQEEQQFLDRAYERLDAMRAAARSLYEPLLAESRGGTFQARTERDVMVRTGMARLAQLDIGDLPLCFGRIDQVANQPVASQEGESGEVGQEGDRQLAGPSGIEVLHLGRLAVWDEEQDPLIVDWRAPVAEPFYRATPLDPMGLRLRRHFDIAARTIRALEDEWFARDDPGGIDLGVPGVLEPETPDGDGTHAESDYLDGTVAGSAALLSALRKPRTGRMGDIVATVQKEQDEIIRAGLSGVLVVQGGPGTGKTAVALHRAAYLLYTHRFPLERQGVLVVGPNPVFLGYIERVLPSLGENGVTLATVSGLYPRIRTSMEEEPRTARLKGDPRMAELIRRAVADRQRPLRKQLSFPFGSKVLRVRPEETARIVEAARRRRGSHNERRRHVEAALLRLLAERYSSTWRQQGDGTDLNGASASSGDSELRVRLRRHPAVVEALERMWPRLTPEELLHDLFGARPLLSSAAKGLLDSDEQDMLYRDRSASVEQVRWTRSDIALLDEALVLLGSRHSRQRSKAAQHSKSQDGANGFWEVSAGFSDGEHAILGRSQISEDLPPDSVRQFGHIVVDEAQDLSPMELRMLGRRSISGSMTMVGDMAQATGPWAPSSWEQVVEHLGFEKPFELMELTVGYRTPAPVMAVATPVLNEALPGVKGPTPVRYGTAHPRAVQAGKRCLASTTARVVAEELAALEPGDLDGSSPLKHACLGVVFPPSLGSSITSALDEAGLCFGEAAKSGLGERITLVSVSMAKGLEFDAVVVVEPTLMLTEAPQGLRALYVALTRATRRLAVVHSQQIPPSLAQGLGHCI
ncbi:MAG: AAA family ATPase [Actinobacteria bacterium]|nr:AAA family ATPase [Actinomycetota bacterium]